MIGDVREMARRLEALERRVDDHDADLSGMPVAFARGGASSGITIPRYANYAAFPTVTSANETEFAYANDLYHLYQVRNGVWRITPHFEMTATPTSIGEQPGDRWYSPTSHIGFWRSSTTWARVTHLNP